MKKLLRELIPVVEYLCSLSVKEVTLHIKTLKPKVLEFLIDFLFNIECGHIFIDAEVVDKIRPYKKQMLSLIVKHKSLKKRKEELAQKGIFHKLFIPLLPVLRTLA